MVIVLVQWLARFVVPVVIPDASFGVFAGVLAGLIGGMAVLAWWLLFSRAPWSERIGAVVVMVVALAATPYILHPSIATGMMGMLFYVYVTPVLSLAFVAWAVISRRFSIWPRRLSLVAAVLLACGVWALVRTDGIISTGSQFAWRWTATPEQQLLADARDEPLDVAQRSLASQPIPAASAPREDRPAAQADSERAPQAGKERTTANAPSPTSAPASAGEMPRASGTSANETPAVHASTTTAHVAWPGFRGPERDGIVRGVRIATDWTTAPPRELWRRPIGPGWSSFAVDGDLLYTQEQRGDDEIVACYSVSTGEPVWRHRDPVRFWESNGGAGPRATPTLSLGRVYAFGATGILNALDAASGAVIWSRNVASDIGRRVPDWGFASSPLIVDDLVIVAAAGTLVAYDRATGDRRWSGPSYGGSYSSPHRATIDGVTQILLLGGPGAISVAPADGAVLWKHTWSPGAIVQPALATNGDVLVNAIASTGGMGLRRLSLTRASGQWNVEERWTSNGLKPYFNDFVVHKGHAFGFDGSILSSIDLEDGKRMWKGGRYGNGQLVLLHDQDVLLVLSEEGELALVGATPDQFRELARFQALDGKTWNHPVLAGDILLTRNGQEMAAFRLSLASR